MNFTTMLSPARLLLLCTLFFASFAIADTAQANDMSLQEAMTELTAAKAQGLVGEKNNGYLGVVTESAEAQMIANLINDARRSEYTRIAEQNNIAVADVEALAGKRAIERTPAGQYIQLDGEWVVKR